MNALKHGERSAGRAAERREIRELVRMAKSYDDIEANHLTGALEARGLPPQNVWWERLADELMGVRH